MERTILLKDLKFQLDTEKLLNYQNNYVELVTRISKFFAALLIIFKIPKLF